MDVVSGIKIDIENGFFVIPYRKIDLIKYIIKKLEKEVDTVDDVEVDDVEVDDVEVDEVKEFTEQHVLQIVTNNGTFSVGSSPQHYTEIMNKYTLWDIRH